GSRICKPDLISWLEDMDEMFAQDCEEAKNSTDSLSCWNKESPFISVKENATVREKRVKRFSQEGFASEDTPESFTGPSPEIIVILTDMAETGDKKKQSAADHRRRHRDLQEEKGFWSKRRRKRIQPGNLVPNRQLANVVEIAKKLSLQGGREGEAKGRTCEKHQEPLKLFCREDRGLICVVCDRSKEHKHHDVVPAEEAAAECKDKLYGYAEILRKEREKIMVHKADAEKQSHDLLKRTESERQKSVAKFKELHQFLEEQEQLLLAQMEEAKKEIAIEWDDQLARLSEDLSSLESQIQEVEEKLQQPASELLQDVESISKRCEKKKKFWNPVSFSQELTWKIRDICVINRFLTADLKKFKDTLASQIQPQRAVNVTLDPVVAFPKLVLSEDHKSVRWIDSTQPLPYNPQIFDARTIVLGREGFTSGRFFWEVTVECEGWWAVGVARKSVRRTGDIVFSPGEGIWAVGKMSLGYMALGLPQTYHFDLNRRLKRIRVALNYYRGQVDFFSCDTAAHLYRFSGASFRGETLSPFFWVIGKGRLSLPQNHSTWATL
ncbi:UNVERIFIED_CONTAM: hypothetical protein K2H54_061218, partial [Gekko kuhli]